MNLRILSLILLFSAPASLRLRAQAPHNPTAEIVLQRMTGAYLAAESYQDTGDYCCVRNGIQNPPSIIFRTYFRRPDFFRFDFDDTPTIPPFHPRIPDVPDHWHVLWSNPAGTYEWWQGTAKVDRSPNVTLGVAGFTGISSRTVHNIPALLQRNLGWQQRLNQVPGLAMAGEEVFEEANCYRLRNSQMELWLGKTDHFIRKVEWTLSDGGKIVETHRDIRFDARIPTRVFQFVPPALEEVSAQTIQ